MSQNQLPTSISSEIDRKDDFVARPAQREFESSSPKAANLPLVGDGEGSTGYRIIALVAMLALAVAAVVFLLYLRS